MPNSEAGSASSQEYYGMDTLSQQEYWEEAHRLASQHEKKHSESSSKRSGAMPEPTQPISNLRGTSKRKEPRSLAEKSVGGHNEISRRDLISSGSTSRHRLLSNPQDRSRISERPAPIYIPTRHVMASNPSPSPLSRDPSFVFSQVSRQDSMTSVESGSSGEAQAVNKKRTLSYRSELASPPHTPRSPKIRKTEQGSRQAATSAPDVPTSARGTSKLTDPSLGPISTRSISSPSRLSSIPTPVHNTGQTRPLSVPKPAPGPTISIVPPSKPSLARPTLTSAQQLRAHPRPRQHISEPEDSDELLLRPAGPRKNIPVAQAIPSSARRALRSAQPLPTLPRANVEVIVIPDDESDPDVQPRVISPRRVTASSPHSSTRQPPRARSSFTSDPRIPVQPKAAKRVPDVSDSKKELALSRPRDEVPVASSSRVSGPPASSPKRPSLVSIEPETITISSDSECELRSSQSLWDQVESIPSSGPLFRSDNGSNAAPSVPSVPSAPSAPSTPSEEPTIVAHHPEVQRYMDAKGIAWGVQWEIARGTQLPARWTWEDVTPQKLDSLIGTNADAAPRVAEILGKGKDKGMLELIWAELDREEKALLTGDAGLGLKGIDGLPKWNGGRIQQIVRIVEEERGKLKLVLDKMEMRKSCRFARELGSSRILQVSIPDKLLRRKETRDRIRELLYREAVICGRIFASMFSRDGKVFMMEVARLDPDGGRRTSGHSRLNSVQAFVQWHNPLDLNGQQSVSKWITRFDLGFSTTVPVLQFDPSKIHYIRDEYAPHDEKMGKPPTEKIFTDGCGFMNAAALHQIAAYFGRETPITAVQGRIAGAKGMWLLHPEDHDLHAPPTIWIRDSQRKIHHAESSLTRAQLIFDLVATPRLTFPSRLSKYTVLNLAHNGVPKDIFTKLMREGLEAEIAPLVEWSRPGAMHILYDAVDHAGHVTASRVQKLAVGLTRALGLSGRVPDRDSQEDDALENVDSSELSFGPDNTEPLGLHECVMEMLKAGFTPDTSSTLYGKLKTIVTLIVENFVRDYHFPISQSAEAFIVPDPYGVLEEGQIHFKATQALKDPLLYTSSDIITGEVLVYRNPARVASDVQKVTAVVHPKLSQYTDVIVLPTKGKRSLASLLAGGDVDGDVCVCIWDQELVSRFQHPPTREPSGDFLADNFESQESIDKVHSLDSRIRGLGPRDAQVELQKTLLAGLNDLGVGQYSKFHENAVYAFGYDHPTTRRLAFMFTTILDSRKTGYKVKDQIFKKDCAEHDREQPECMKPKPKSKDQAAYSTVNKRYLSRKVDGPFILEELFNEGKALGNEKLRAFDQLAPSQREHRDPHLTKNYNDAESATSMPIIGPRKLPLVRCIRDFVDMHYASWRSQCGSSPSKPSSSNGAKAAKLKALAFQRITAQFNRSPFEDVPPEEVKWLREQTELIKASYAYTLSEKFAFSVALRTLCDIKARESPSGSSTSTLEFGKHSSISRSVIKLLQQSLSSPS